MMVIPDSEAEAYLNIDIIYYKLIEDIILIL